MATVRVEPAGLTFEVQAGEAVMTAAVRAGYRWPNICGGLASCRTCFVAVLDGHDHLSAIDPIEQAGLDSIRRTRPEGELTRLACQLRLTGDATVRKRGVSREHHPTAG
jgi:ferredoxin